jgi:hypothetical protein
MFDAQTFAICSTGGLGGITRDRLRKDEADGKWKTRNWGQSSDHLDGSCRRSAAIGFFVNRRPGKDGADCGCLSGFSQGRETMRRLQPVCRARFVQDGRWRRQPTRMVQNLGEKELIIASKLSLELGRFDGQITRKNVRFILREHIKQCERWKLPNKSRTDLNGNDQVVRSDPDRGYRNSCRSLLMRD